MPTLQLRLSLGRVQQLFSYFIHSGRSLPFLQIEPPTVSTQIPTRVFLRLHSYHSPNTDTYYSLLQTCVNMSQLKQVHAQLFLLGFNRNVFLGAKLVNMYAKCGSLENARLVFDKIHERDVFLWNAMLTGYARKGTSKDILILYHQMQEEGIQPDNFTFSFVLKACADLSALPQGKNIHSHIIKTGFQPDVFVETGLIDMYVKCGSIENARQAFDKKSQENVVSWTAIIGAYALCGHAVEALKFFNRMQLVDVKPNPVTMVNVLSACAHLGDMQQGKLIHACVIKSGFESNFYVETALIDMYAKWGRICDAHQVFDKMTRRDVVSWSAMIAGCAHNGLENEALSLFNQMQLAHVKPNSVTVLSVLLACAKLGALPEGKSIHNYIIGGGFQSDTSVQNSLISMYARCGIIEVACNLFEKMSNKNVVSWNSMIAGYAQNGHTNEALELFYQMRLANVIPDSVTMVSALLACDYVGALHQGKLIHGYIMKSGFMSNVFVATALIDMYAKCGSVDIAREVFDKTCNRNVVLWSAMIAGYGIHGHGQDALALFSQMQQTGLRPNHITFICLLSACSHAGLVDEGLQYFDCMSQDYGITPRMKHYACMVDLLGRAGHLNKAQEFIQNMPLKPDVSVWGALLGACRIHCNTGLGEHVADCLFDLQPKDPGYYVLLSNIYAAAGRWNDVTKVRTMMKDRGLRKTPGCSLIEVNNRVHAFFVGDRSHPQSEHIYATLETLGRQIEAAGYVPSTNFVLHDVEEEVKEHMLYSHSEKLAIVFGLINTLPGTPIRITKNLRVCGDCHNATKFISKTVKREIIMRDANRFHQFRDGLCSCGDYW
eukprot:Gb_29869 [translate_table: standard]